MPAVQKYTCECASGNSGFKNQASFGATPSEHTCFEKLWLASCAFGRYASFCLHYRVVEPDRTIGSELRVEPFWSKQKVPKCFEDLMRNLPDVVTSRQLYATGAQSSTDSFSRSCEDSTCSPGASWKCSSFNQITS